MIPEPIGTPHDHRTIVPGCHRCEIGRDEEPNCEMTCTLPSDGHQAHEMKRADK